MIGKDGWTETHNKYYCEIMIEKNRLDIIKTGYSDQFFF